jgi:protocatechuate 3,4-dioxygenase beta subunit
MPTSRPYAAAKPTANRCRAHAASISTCAAPSSTPTAARCDAFGSYRHPRGAGARIDAGFQGFGSTRSDARGMYRFLTIRPVPYPGRTPHIHVKLRHPAFGEVTSQLFVAGEPGNAGDFLYQSLGDADRKEVELRLRKPAAGELVAWVAERDLVVAR